MHTLVRRYLFTAFGFLVVGIVLGVIMLARRELGGVWGHPYLATAHTHTVLVGFVMFMIFGVAQWMFPRPQKGDVRYSPALAEAVYWLLTVSTVLRLTGELARAAWDVPQLKWAILTGGIGQAVGFVAYIWNMRSRIRQAGSKLREDKGERF
ncbi:MAG: cbb3-type cytochrome c oxidase subunit I [Gemmatimonadota bacterium]|nr:cbb3-type cytochrome c oxidase subunit I [Gemmatimonadota bacterium]